MEKLHIKKPGAALMGAPGFLSLFSKIRTISKKRSSPNDSIGDPSFKVWIPDYTLGNDIFLVVLIN
jgi:hypothetical protein